MLLPVSAFLLLTAVLGPNLLQPVCAVVVLAIGSAILWRPMEPPILWFTFVFQWIEASLHVFYLTFVEVPIGDDYFESDPTYATWLAMLGLLSLAAGMRLAAGSPRIDRALGVINQISQLPQLRLLKFYVVMLLVATSVPWFADLVPGLRQPLLVANYLKWAAYVMFTIVTFGKSDTSRALWLLVFFLEFAQGLGGYFSSFKFVFLYTFLGIMASGYSPKVGHITGAIILLVSALFVGSIWSEIKAEYRQYVNAGQSAQVVSVGYVESLSKIYELVTRMDGHDLRAGFDKLLNRISYVGFFSAATEYVPEHQEHSDGAILLDAVSRPFMPRLFFPDKPVIDESSLVRQYTGIWVADAEYGTQVSLGFYGESYVDFGIYGVIFGLFGWGLFLGAAYRWLVYGRYSGGIIGYGLASAVLIQAYGIGVSSAKLFGGVVTALGVLYVFNRFVVPRYLGWLRPAAETPVTVK